jgi:hypothetical protein
MWPITTNTLRKMCAHMVERLSPPLSPRRSPPDRCNTLGLCRNPIRRDCPCRFHPSLLRVCRTEFVQLSTELSTPIIIQKEIKRDDSSLPPPLCPSPIFAFFISGSLFSLVLKEDMDKDRSRLFRSCSCRSPFSFAMVVVSSIKICCFVCSDCDCDCDCVSVWQLVVGKGRAKF